MKRDDQGDRVKKQDRIWQKERTNQLDLNLKEERREGNRGLDRTK